MRNVATNQIHRKLNASAQVHRELGYMKSEYEDLLDAIIPTWRDMTQTQLAEMYIDITENPASEFYGDEDFRGIVFAGLLVKNWGIIVNALRSFISSRITALDCYDILCKAITKAIKYRAWQKPDCSLSKSADGAKNAISVCAVTTIGDFMNSIGRDARCINYRHLVSFDAMQNCFVDYNLETFCEDIDSIIDTQADEHNKLHEVVGNVMSYNIDCAIVLDAICFQDVLNKGKLSKNLLLKYIRALTAQDCVSLGVRYSISADTIKAHVTKMQARKSLNIYVNSLITMAKNDRSVMDICC